MYTEPVRPFLSAEPDDALSAQQRDDELLDIEDVIGKHFIETRLNRW